MSNPGTALATIDGVVATLQHADTQVQIKRLLPADVTLERFTQAAVTAIRTKPEILECEKQSLYNAILRCAQDGLEPDGRQAALVSFNTNVGTKDKPVWVKKCQALKMVEGVIHLFGKAGVSAYAASVYANDKVRIWNDDDGQHVYHEPVMFGDRGERIGAYASGKSKTGRTWVEAMSMADLEVPKKATKQKDRDGNLTGPWRDVPDRMEQKSCLHRLSKRIPSIALRDDEDDGEGPQIVQVIEPPEPVRQTRAVVPGRPRALQAAVDQVEPEEAPAPPKEPPQEPARPDEVF